jgi:hypothetical protein
MLLTFLMLLMTLKTSFAQMVESRVVMLKGSGAPTASCVAGERYFRTDGTAGQNLYLCTATDTWTRVTGTVTAGASGGIIVSGGNEVDIDTAIVCRTTASCAPTGAQNFSGSSATRPTKESAADPATCTEGEMLYNTTSKATKRCTATNTWTTIGGGSSLPTPVAGDTYYCPLLCSFQTLVSAVSTPTPHYLKIWLPHEITANRLAMRNVTGLGGGQSMAIALYDSGGTKITNSDSRITAQAAGAFVFSFGSTLTLGPGTVIVGWASEINQDLAAIDNCCQLLNTALNAGSNKRFFTATGSTSGTGVTYTMPASISSFTASADAVANFVFLYN